MDDKHKTDLLSEALGKNKTLLMNQYTVDVATHIFAKWLECIWCVVMIPRQHGRNVIRWIMTMTGKIPSQT